MTRSTYYLTLAYLVQYFLPWSRTLNKDRNFDFLVSKMVEIHAHRRPAPSTISTGDVLQLVHPSLEFTLPTVCLGYVVAFVLGVVFLVEQALTRDAVRLTGGSYCVLATGTQAFRRRRH